MIREYRVKTHREFDEIIKNGVKLKSPHFSIYYQTSSNNFARVGIAVGKSNGIAITRVKIKRQIRAILADSFDFDQKSVNLIIIAKPNYSVGEFTLLKEELIGLLAKIEE